MNRLLDWLSQTSPDEAMIPGTSLAAIRVRRMLRQLRQRAQNGDKAGDRARRMLEYLESGAREDAKFEGVSLFKLQSVVERARSRTRPESNSALVADRPVGKTLQKMITDVSQGNPSDTWVDDVNITRLENWLARLRRSASGISVPHATHAGRIAGGARDAPPAQIKKAASEEEQRLVRTDVQTARKSEWIEDFLD